MGRLHLGVPDALFSVVGNRVPEESEDPKEARVRKETR